jgi:hypothetical protein
MAVLLAIVIALPARRLNKSVCGGNAADPVPYTIAAQFAIVNRSVAAVALLEIQGVTRASVTSPPSTT